MALGASQIEPPWRFAAESTELLPGELGNASGRVGESMMELPHPRIRRCRKIGFSVTGLIRPERPTAAQFSGTMLGKSFMGSMKGLVSRPAAQVAKERVSCHPDSVKVEKAHQGLSGEWPRRPATGLREIL
jgi:hypothetical protein